MNKIRILCATLLFPMVFLVVFIPLYFYFNVDLPANIAYNKALGSKVTMLYDAGTIEDFYNRTIELKTAIINEFAGQDIANLHCNWLPWDQIPENTVAENIRWIKSFEQRCKFNVEEMLAIKNGSKPLLTPYASWEQLVIGGMRNETRRAGGVVWAAEGAWYQVHQPSYYNLHHQFWWFGLFDVVWGICLLLAMIFVLGAIYG